MPRKKIDMRYNARTIEGCLINLFSVYKAEVLDDRVLLHHYDQVQHNPYHFQSGGYSEISLEEWGRVLPGITDRRNDN
jgi:hypothetical protein